VDGLLGLTTSPWRIHYQAPTMISLLFRLGTILTTYSIPISCSYKADGIKVEEKALIVGMIRALNAGGANSAILKFQVQRTVILKP